MAMSCDGDTVVWEAMTPHQRDQCIARYVFGQSGIAAEEALPPYSTSMKAAWTLVAHITDRMSPRTPQFRLEQERDGSGRWCATFLDPKGNVMFAARRTTDIEAVCVAALRAYNAPVRFAPEIIYARAAGFAGASGMVSAFSLLSQTTSLEMFGDWPNRGYRRWLVPFYTKHQWLAWPLFVISVLASFVIGNAITNAIEQSHVNAVVAAIAAIFINGALAIITSFLNPVIVRERIETHHAV